VLTIVAHFAGDQGLITENLGYVDYAFASSLLRAKSLA